MALIALVSTTQSTKNQHHFFIQPHPLTLVVLMSTLIQQSWTKKAENRNSLKISEDYDNKIINSEENFSNRHLKTHMTSENILNRDLQEIIDKTDSNNVNKITNFEDVDGKENNKNRLEENISIIDKVDKNILKNGQITNLIINNETPSEINSAKTNFEEIENKINFKNRLKENLNIDGKKENNQIRNNNFIKEEDNKNQKINEEQLKLKPAKAKSRQKRVLWLTEDGRLALPPGTTMVITPSLSMPFVRYPPEGFFSNITVSLPFTIDFDKLGLTDNENPYGVLPPVLARSMGRAAGGILADYIGNIFEHRRGKRSPGTRPPAPPSSKIGHFHGGERALLYVAVEELLENFGLDGKACLLRAICEVHSHPMKGFGIIGEMLRLFLSASKSPYSDLMKDYVEAENAGRGGAEGHGECWPYMKDCPKSLFLTKHNKYSDELEENEILDEEFANKEVTYDPTVRNM